VSTIVDGLWDEPPDGADRTVRQYVSRLRRQMPAEAGEVIVTQPPGYLVAADPDAVDAQCFRRLAERGRRELARNDPATAAVTLAEALQLWRGEVRKSWVAPAESARTSTRRPGRHPAR